MELIQVDNLEKYIQIVIDRTEEVSYKSSLII